ncbi:MAG: glutamine--fructose-6-phosphate transaminase (isomerizing), partial [Pseudomonadota bacterium]
MCGIVGITGHGEVAGRLLEGLARLEYRGYDSAGIAVAKNGSVERRRAAGRLEALRSVVGDAPAPGKTGIAHTRWATHGKPTETNAHPHMSGRAAIVHNGIIENFQDLKNRLEAAGRVFSSDTDSEVIAQLLGGYMDDGLGAEDAFGRMLSDLNGAFAIAAVFAGEEGLLIGARKGSPLVLGYGDGEMYLGSDAIALAPLTREVTYLEEGDWVVAYPDAATIRDTNGNTVERPRVRSRVSAAMVELGPYDHFMQKEIHEQPESTARSLAPYVDPGKLTTICDPQLMDVFERADRVVAVSCGTSYYASQVAKYWFEDLAGLSFETDVASEFRYRKPVLPQTGPALLVSQSGETADTLAALRHCKTYGVPNVAIVNVPESSIARDADFVVPTQAGPEIGVASTKAFTAQLAVLATLAISAAKARGRIDEGAERDLLSSLVGLPRLINETLTRQPKIIEAAEILMTAENALYIGRGIYCPLAYEGALKLKEISYIHAEGYPAGELKHGPIALLEEGLPVVVVAPQDRLF